ncbi:MAG TPA: hypothetical protein VE995_05735 [Gaiellaceae bacterium]|nr:hypothetical protein [Gaiellaceae bacterium]
MDDAQTTWERLEQAELELDGVSRGTGFGRSEGLRIRGKIYAIRRDDELIFKLPAERVEALVASGAGRPWGPGAGRIMREWVAVSGAHRSDWASLAGEARAFVGAR